MHLSIATTLLAIGISVFTLTTAFIVSKQDALKDIEEKIEQIGVSLTLARKVNASRAFVRNMIRISKKSIVIIICSGISLLQTILFIHIGNTPYAHLIWVSTLPAIIFVALCIIDLFRWFYTRI